MSNVLLNEVKYYLSLCSNLVFCVVHIIGAIFIWRLILDVMITSKTAFYLITS